MDRIRPAAEEAQPIGVGVKEDALHLVVAHLCLANIHVRTFGEAERRRLGRPSTALHAASS
jgi:hypothetical protein